MSDKGLQKSIVANEGHRREKSENKILDPTNKRERGGWNGDEMENREEGGGKKDEGSS